MADLPEPICAPELGAVPHGFMTRCGGVSTGPVAGLQAGHGAGDDPQAVEANRKLARDAVLPGSTLVTPYQVHSADVVAVEEAWAYEDRPKADALVTDKPGLLLGIVTADCAPVLLADAESGVVAAVHAGWRGAQAGIIANAVGAMVKLGAQPSRIAAVIGPTIAQASYEVGMDMRAEFDDADAAHFAQGKPGHYHFDLPGYLLARLEEQSVGSARALNLDTYADESRFFSFRRATHRGEPNYGRQISLIGLAQK